MQLYDPKHLGVPGGGLFSAREKWRLVLMIAGAVVFIGAIVFLRSESTERQANQLADATSVRVVELPTNISVPRIDVAAIEAAAADERPEQRVVLPGEALEAGFAQSGQVFDGNFKALGGRELSSQIALEIVQAPKQHRGQLLRTRCFVDEMRELANPDSAGNPRRFVRGHLEDGAAIFFAVQEIVGLAPVPGEFVRMDGLFVRVQREEVDGKWCEAPLLVGPRMYESVQRLAPVKALDAQSFSTVRDDEPANGIGGLEEIAYWQLVSYVQNLEPGTIDWDKAAVLDDATISSIQSDGTSWRGKPVRAPVALMLDVWKQAQPENPLRLDHLVEGWFGRGDWFHQAKVAHFVAPFDEVPPNVQKNVVVRAFFYKNLAYERKNGALAVAPFFIVQSLEPFVMPENTGMRQIAYMAATTMGILAIGVFAIWRRDRNSSAALEAELLRRRRERRQKLFPAGKP